MKRITIAIASPTDLKAERDAVQRVFTNWNDKNEQATLHPKMWEFAVPELGSHPQKILNKKIIEVSDLLIAMFWSKLGTPTPDSASGTVEEIFEFIRIKGPQRVMLYFCQRDLPYDINPAELTRLNSFKAQMKSQGLFHQFTTVQEFEKVLYPHLDEKVGEFLAGNLPLPNPEDQSGETENENTEHPDKRLHKLIEFGTDLRKSLWVLQNE